MGLGCKRAYIKTGGEAYLSKPAQADIRESTIGKNGI